MKELFIVCWSLIACRVTHFDQKYRHKLSDLEASAIASPCSMIDL